MKKLVLTYDTKGNPINSEEIDVPDPEPTNSTHIATLQAINIGSVRPAHVKRVFQGIDFFYDCFVTESVKDHFIQGNIQIGDFLLVHFDDNGEQIVTHKVFKSW